MHFVTAYELFFDMITAADVIVAHNANFDLNVIVNHAKAYHKAVQSEYIDPFKGKTVICTMLASKNIVKATPKKNGEWKWPTLQETVRHFFNEDVVNAHDALSDVYPCRKVFHHLVDIGTFN